MGPPVMLLDFTTHPDILVPMPPPTSQLRTVYASGLTPSSSTFKDLQTWVPIQSRRVSPFAARATRYAARESDGESDKVSLSRGTFAENVPRPKTSPITVLAITFSLYLRFRSGKNRLSFN
ncbi:hypothetical protein L6452_04938 [Arctium lappa]|uniref:Uncharacterized protein n=1 Tax=Arctium lappa TaxID=4217 RepID=A0ACB9EFA7_ARCLA|nr:hypothetical protein L6452_04938 [Arctium lappa]